MCEVVTPTRRSVGMSRTTPMNPFKTSDDSSCILANSSRFAHNHLRMDRPRREIRAAVVALVVGASLLGVKFLAYLLTDSAAIFSDALESIVNVVAAAAALYSVILAHRPADQEHPYGHGKVEFMSAGFEGGMMLVAAFVMGLRAVEQFWQGALIS